MHADPPTAAAIRSRNEILHRALDGHDFAAVGLIYFEWAVLYPHDVDDVIGRERIVRYWHHFRNMRVTFEASALTRLSDDCVQEMGRLRTSRSPEQAGSSATRYLTTWAKDGGEWQIATSIFNRTAPLQRDTRTLAENAVADVGPRAVYVPRVP